jgi:hypothetical protein
MPKVLAWVRDKLFTVYGPKVQGKGYILAKGASLGNRGSRFLSYNFLQFAIDGKNNSKTKVEKVFFFIFMSSYAEMSFLKQKITKQGQKIFFCK